MCKFISDLGHAQCNRFNCQFAHHKSELLPKPASNYDNYKTQNCRGYHKELYCGYGLRCHFRHEKLKTTLRRKYYHVRLLNIFENQNEQIEFQSSLVDEDYESMPSRGQSRLPIFDQVTSKAADNDDSEDFLLGVQALEKQKNQDEELKKSVISS